VSTPASRDQEPPRRGNAFSRALATTALKLAGWRIEGGLPREPRFVTVVAPHTSNWDFLVAVAAMFAVGLRLTWLGKHTLFRWPADPVLRWLGGEPVDRSVQGGTVSQAVQRFRAEPRYALGMAPEGTRKRVTEWKSGFHRIARQAGVPLFPVWLDYGARTVRLGAPIWPTEDADADIARLRATYTKDMARNPEQFAELESPST
jgi:1-acyl-sn-glycerol-3-phosphate acyltransferase